MKSFRKESQKQICANLTNVPSGGGGGPIKNELGMERFEVCSANYIALTPIGFLERAAFVYGHRDAIIYGNNKFSWKQTHHRCINLASSLSHLGIHPGDIVAAMAPNIPQHYELHFGVPMAGAVLSSLNTKLDSTTLSLKLAMLQPKAIFIDYEYVKVVLESLALAKTSPSPLLILILDDTNPVENGQSGFEMHNEFPENGHFDFKIYDELIEAGESDFKIVYPEDECDPIAINFTSGSTGKPKGVVYSHRATYLNTIGQIFRADMAGKTPIFLWTVDMFRCNGWCMAWTMAALGGTNICTRDTSGKAILDAIFYHNVTHLCGQPLILTKIAHAIESECNMSFPTNILLASPRHQKVNVIVAGVLPPREILSTLEKWFNISYAYGMTEALGPMTSTPWNVQENFRPDLTEEEKHRIGVRVREGIHNIMVERADVKDPVTMESVPGDGETIGEIMFRSNTMMLGYFKNKQGTQEAFEGGWYRTRDIGVKHPSGYIELKDRGVDVIKCGTKIISSLEIQSVLVRHPMVLEAAVVGKPHEVLGQTPCAFVKLKEGCFAIEEDIIKFCVDNNLPHHMVPHDVIFGDLPLNSTGKIQKIVLRDKTKCL